MLYKITGLIEDLTTDINGDKVYIQQGALDSNQAQCIPSGITWEIYISSHSKEYFTSYYNDALPIHIYTWIHHSEKDLVLYGFYSLAERSVFLTLLKVSGIGPKMAIKILSHKNPETILSYIKEKNVDLLAKIPGIGNKKASKILLTLEGTYIPTPLVDDTTASNEKSETPHGDIVDALIHMGYSKENIHKLLSQEMPSSFFEREEGEILKELIIRLETQ